MIRACACGRTLKPSERLALLERRRCPDCGATTHRWEKPFFWWPRWLRRRKPQEPRYTPQHPGPRFLGIDYGFRRDATVLFVREDERARVVYVERELHLTAHKNRWRFWQL